MNKTKHNVSVKSLKLSSGGKFSKNTNWQRHVHVTRQSYIQTDKNKKTETLKSFKNAAFKLLCCFPFLENFTL